MIAVYLTTAGNRRLIATGSKVGFCLVELGEVSSGGDPDRLVQVLHVDDQPFVYMNPYSEGEQWTTIDPGFWGNELEFVAVAPVA